MTYAHFMRSLPPGVALGLATVLALAACAPAPARDAVGAPPSGQPGVPRGTLKIAWSTEPDTLGAKFTTGSGSPEFVWIFNSFLTYFDFNGNVHPMMAREIPTQANGDFVVNPDGTMITTYRLRESIRWHDGTPLGAEDFVFAFEVYMDPAIPVRDRTPESLMSRVEAADSRTLVVRWREPYLRANMLGYQQLDPLPRHLLEERYRTNKAQFALGEEWKSAYVGVGPFRMERWDPGSGMIARANTEWFLGPPKLETLDIRFITDTNTLLATLLSGEVHMTTSPAVRGAEAAVARDQWVARGEGYLKTWETRLRYFFYQFREVPNWQPALTDLRVRQALLHAIDRQELVEAINFGLGSPADSFVAPSDPLFGELDRAITKYPFDLNRASALLADAGWRRTPGSELLANAAGQAFDLEVSRNAGPKDEQEISIIADKLKGLGINSRLFIIPAARARDGEIVSFFPGIQTIARTISAENFVFTSSDLPNPQLRWQGSNRGSFVDPEVDRLQNVIMTSLDTQDRQQARIALHKRMSEVLGIGPLYYEVEVILARKNVKGPVGNYGPQQGITWNVFEWELTD